MDNADIEIPAAVWTRLRRANEIFRQPNAFESDKVMSATVAKLKRHVKSRGSFINRLDLITAYIFHSRKFDLINLPALETSDDQGMERLFPSIASHIERPEKPGRKRTRAKRGRPRGTLNRYSLEQNLPELYCLIRLDKNHQYKKQRVERKDGDQVDTKIRKGPRFISTCELTDFLVAYFKLIFVLTEKQALTLGETLQKGLGNPTKAQIAFNEKWESLRKREIKLRTLGNKRKFLTMPSNKISK